VTICFLNAEQFLQEAIESILAQTFTNWELVLVDDGSTDGSTQIARAFVSRHPDKIRYVDHDGHKNRGLSTSRNAGVAHASGKYLAFLDADDRWLPHKLAKQVAVMESMSHVDCYVNPGLYCYPDGSGRPQPMAFYPGLVPAHALTRCVLRDDVNTPLPSCILIRRDFYSKLGGFADWAPNIVEDQVFWLQLDFPATFHFDPECLVLYRVHPASICKSTPPQTRLMEKLRLHAWLVDRFEKSRGTGPRRQLFLRMARFKLWQSLLEYSDHMEGGGAYSFDEKIARLARNSRYLGEYRSRLGPVFSFLFLFNGISWRGMEFIKRLARLIPGNPHHG
jgi:glycosyltransferase involved in cell wall biosynthesis